MTQLDIFLGRDARDDAIDRAEGGVCPYWRKAALDAVRDVAAMRPGLTTDAVWTLLERRSVSPPREPRAMGAVMREATRRGLVEGTDRTRQSVRPDCHRRPVRIWKSLIYRGENNA